MLNPNRNPGVSKADFETMLKPLPGIDKIIWFPEIAGRDITDAHTDFYARFAAPGVVLFGYDPDPASYDHAVTHKHIEILRAATDVNDKLLDVRVLEGPTEIRETWLNDYIAAGYVGFYVCNGGVVAQQFGDSRPDAASAEQLRALFPDRELVQIAIDGIAAGVRAAAGLDQRREAS